MHLQTKHTAIPKAVKERVYERDHHQCLFCGRYVDVSNASAHYIARSHGGLGIEENLLTLCDWCHNQFDNSEYRQEMKLLFGRYLKAHYPDLDESKLIYKKGMDYATN